MQRGVESNVYSMLNCKWHTADDSDIHAYAITAIKDSECIQWQSKMFVSGYNHDKSKYNALKVAPLYYSELPTHPTTIRKAASLV